MNRRRLIRALPIAFASLAMAAGPAAAHHGQGSHTQQVSEDDDADGVPDDQPDDGDDRHPSGRDRSIDVDNGNARSDPDDDGRGPDRSNGGVDQPGGDGGVDQHDQDRNNGCGNDDDFEDDNEGLCLGPDGERPRAVRAQQERPEEAPTETEGGSTGSGSQEDVSAPTGDSEVLGAALERSSGAANAGSDGGAVLGDGSSAGTDAPSGEPQGEVLGITLERDDADVVAAGDTLPLTGTPLGALGAAAVGALAAGTAAVRRRDDA